VGLAGREVGGLRAKRNRSWRSAEVNFILHAEKGQTKRGELKSGGSGEKERMATTKVYGKFKTACKLTALQEAFQWVSSGQHLGHGKKKKLKARFKPVHTMEKKSDTFLTLRKAMNIPEPTRNHRGVV